MVDQCLLRVEITLPLLSRGILCRAGIHDIFISAFGTSVVRVVLGASLVSDSSDTPVTSALSPPRPRFANLPRCLV